MIFIILLLIYPAVQGLDQRQYVVIRITQNVKRKRPCSVLSFLISLSYLCCGAQGLLQLSALLLIIQAALVAVVGNVTQDQCLLRNGQNAALHRRHLKQKKAAKTYEVKSFDR